MTPGEQAEQLADEMQQEAFNIARAWLEMFEMQDDGPAFTREAERLAFDAGVHAGYIGTLQMLQKRGLLPGGEG